MQTASLREQFINVITYNHGRELWYSRYDQSFEELMDPLLDELAEIARSYKEDSTFKLHVWDEEESIYDGQTVSHIIGRKIRDLQDAKGWSLNKLAKVAGVDRGYLQGVERGECLLGMSSLESIASALGVHSSELLPF